MKETELTDLTISSSRCWHIHMASEKAFAYFLPTGQLFGLIWYNTKYSIIQHNPWLQISPFIG